MAASHGSSGLFKLTSGGSLRDLSAYVETTGLQRDIDQAETSALGTSDKSYIPGLSGATIPLEGFLDPTIDGYIETVRSTQIAGGTAWEYYPAGSATSRVKYSGSAYVAKYELKTSVNDANKMTGELQVTGAITRAVL